jgi:hypothetical protein
MDEHAEGHGKVLIELIRRPLPSPAMQPLVITPNAHGRMEEFA